MTLFYLGVSEPSWLWTTEEVPMFVSHRRLIRRKSGFPPATTRWALDSGGFTEIKMNGEWRTTPHEYVERVYQYRDELGFLDWASPQDWMCEPEMLEKTGRSVLDHQKLTVENYLELRALGPDLPFVPVLQGWELADYIRCMEMYRDGGIDLATEAIVGVGSVCRRQHTTSIRDIFRELDSYGLSMHGFGVKKQGLMMSHLYLDSADSMSWSLNGRKRSLTACPKNHCGNCKHHALSYYEAVNRELRAHAIRDLI